MEKNIIDLAAWLESPVGRYVLEWEQAQLAKRTVDIFGYNAVQIGMPQINGLAASRMPNRWLTNAVGNAPSGSSLLVPQRPVVVVHDFSELPFETQSIDLVVLPHVLEFANEPHQLLREVERVLIPEGRVIISGFNQASFWGVRQAAGRLNKHYFLPQEGEFISFTRMKDWLKLLSMEIGEHTFGCYVPPCRSEKWLQRFHFMENAGKKWWPYLGAVYMVQAVKRVRGMHLIGPAWKQKRLARGNAVVVANKVKTK
ncbi:class I SAM-dependent methyltransferase [Undibacterium sp. RuRC25W]|uniref:class I SAM-dependent methyltransferase n=1 Tax=Undibacterium sp. RuRC25W TaxID=3413047 RepID=UPI003BF333E4